MMYWWLLYVRIKKTPFKTEKYWNWRLIQIQPKQFLAGDESPLTYNSDIYASRLYLWLLIHPWIAYMPGTENVKNHMPQCLT